MKKRINLTYTQIIALSFLGVIIIGAILLSLPIASRSDKSVSIFDSLFTATSATCVTGLIVRDTFTQWTVFGQIVILTMIQIGGLGFMTLMSMFSMILRRKIGLKKRKLLVQSSGTMQLNGVMHLIRKILVGTFIFESIGAIILSLRFCPSMGIARGIYNGIFHSVSAFCNAGFDLMGKYGQFSSLTTFNNDTVVCITVALLIIIGGIGFIVWNDIFTHKLHFKNYELHSKIVIVSTAILVISGWIIFYYTERNGQLLDMSFTDKLVNSFFQSVTPRTAGFNTIDQSQLSESGNILTVLFMFIGASPGSTGGGIKTTTVLVLLLGVISETKRSDDAVIFKKTIASKQIKQAGAIVTVYLTAATIASIIICAFSPFGVKQVVYEVVSAIGTVGLTTGITPMLGTVPKVILMLLMFAGRVGGMSMVLILTEKHNLPAIDRPVENIMIG